MNDDKLLRQLQAQTPEALETLMTRYNRLIYKIIYNILGPDGTQGDVEELVSDTFYAVWNHAHNIQAGKLKAYLCITARNKAKNHLRSHKALPMDLDTVDIRTTDASPEESVIKEELTSMIKKAIHKMTPKDREIFLRYYYYLQTAQEIADKMGIPSSTVRSRLVRGRKILQKILDKEVIF